MRERGYIEYFRPWLEIEPDDEVIQVPTWLNEDIEDYFSSPQRYGWGWQYPNQLEFDLIIALAERIRSHEEFDFLINVIKEERYALALVVSAAQDFVDKVTQRFEQQREHQRMKHFCVICKERARIDDFDVCAVCRREHWMEEQHIKVHLYRAKKANTPATLMLGQWINTLKRYNNQCAYCTNGPYEVLEHYIPISSGGGTTEENCIPACKTCNLKKSDDNPNKVIHQK